MMDLLICKTRKLEDHAEKLWMIGAQIQEISTDLTLLVEEVENHAFRVNEEMKKFKEGFAYERTKTTSKRGKEPVVHCVEPKGNKRKPN